jgi:hypothetical protein
MCISSVCDSILLEACEDYVGLWSVIWEFREIFKEAQESATRQKTIKVIKSLLEDDLIYAGQFNIDGEFERWDGTYFDVLSRIEAEWDELGREPEMGEIVWFEATEKGEMAIVSSAIASL